MEITGIMFGKNIEIRRAGDRIEIESNREYESDCYITPYYKRVYTYEFMVGGQVFTTEISGEMHRMGVVKTVDIANYTKKKFLTDEPNEAQIAQARRQYVPSFKMSAQIDKGNVVHWITNADRRRTRAERKGEPKLPKNEYAARMVEMVRAKQNGSSSSYLDILIDSRLKYDSMERIDNIAIQQVANEIHQMCLYRGEPSSLVEEIISIGLPIEEIFGSFAKYEKYRKSVESIWNVYGETWDEVSAYNKDIHGTIEDEDEDDVVIDYAVKMFKGVRDA